MTSFADQITDLAIPDSTPTFAFEPPKIWWHNGVKQAKTAGSFYTRASEFANGLSAPWATEERFEGEQGYSTSALKIAVLAVRSQAMRKYKDAEGRDQVEWLMRWEQGASVYTELLCMMEGYDGPVVLAVKGLTGKAITGKGGILQNYQNGLLKEAARVAKRSLPLWSFWLPISSKQSNGKTTYEDTGFGSFVTPPALHLPDAPMDALFVGPELIARGAEILNDMIDWPAFKRLPQNVVEGEVVNAPQLPAPKNPVVSIDDTY
jgi:hypothetical protein